MNQAQYTRASEIQTEIAQLKQHKVDACREGKDCVRSSWKTHNNGDILKEQFMPIKYGVLMNLYSLAIDSRIKELETEFANL